MNPHFCRTVITLIFCTSSAMADWRVESGFTRLQLIAGPELPTAVTAGLTQVEAFEPTAKYAPDITSPLFLGKNFTLMSGASSASNHAQKVATNFYATSSQVPGSCPVDLYGADNWLGSGFLRINTTSLPDNEPRAVQNHSWIAGLAEDDAIEANRRLDYAIQTQGFVCVVGQNNSSTNPLPQLFGQGYHSISVGRSDGDHSAGQTTLDGLGRIKPDIVAPSAAPENATSWTTPMVAGAAGLLFEKISQLPVATTSRPLLVKSLLMATARKDNLPVWSNTTSRPLDLRYGSGNLNTHHAYLALRAGKASSSSVVSHGIRGWSDESVAANSSKTWFFTVPPGAPSTPFCTALTWNRAVTTQISGGGPNRTRIWNSSLGNMDLRLHRAADFTVGEELAASLSTVDNVELIYQSELAPGNYALVVDSSSPSTTPIGLAWHSLPAVNISAPISQAREIDGQAGSITLTRSGDTTLPLWVSLIIGGSAIAGTHYAALTPDILIPAGQSSVSLAVTPIADFLAQGDRTVIVSVAADFASVTSPGENATVTIQDKPFDAWRFVNFSTSELADPLTSGETADPDHDGLANLIEYALALDPLIPNASTINADTSSGYLAFLIAKNTAATDISWSAEVSEDLTIWQDAFIETNDANTFAARDTVLINAAALRFIRLKITRQ